MLLFVMIQECYRICKITAKEQMTEIKRHAWDIASCLHQQPDQLVEARQTVHFTLIFFMSNIYVLFGEGGYYKVRRSRISPIMLDLLYICEARCFKFFQS